MSTQASPVRPAIAPDDGYTGPRRALILAGGGIRVAYQAGVVRALHEAGLRFHHADGASGGMLNLAMLCSGLAPDAICARWRTLNPRDSISLLPLHQYLRPHRLPAMGDANGLIDDVFPHLGIDVARIRAMEGMVATFNVANYTRKTNVAVTHDAIGQELLVAGVSLPIFLPPVRHEDELWLDSVWIKQANLMEAVRRGAEELWLIWCIGNTGTYNDGVLAQYVHMIELSANGALYEELDRISELNERIARGDSPYGQTRPVRLHVIRPEHPLPLDPAYYAGHIDGATLIAMGYADAMAYLDDMSGDGLPLQPEVTRMETSEAGLMFRETLSGMIVLGQDDPRAIAARGGEASPLTLNLAVVIRDLDHFLDEPGHSAELYGHISLEPHGTDVPCHRGRFTLFAPTDHADERRMVYELGYVHDGLEYYLVGEKVLHDDPGPDLWSDTTTLFTRLHAGRDRSGPVIGAGVVRLDAGELLRLVRSMHVTNAGSTAGKARALARFGSLFLGQLWSTYGAVAAPDDHSGHLRFTEEMAGFLAIGESDPARGHDEGKRDLNRLKVHLTIRIDGMDRFVADPAHEATAEGWITCDALGGRLPVEQGTFNLFVADGAPHRRQMRYRLFFRDTVGHPLTLVGHKEIENDAGIDVWKDTTTLFTRILGGHVAAGADANAPIVGAGIIRIHPLGFLRQMTTFRTGGASLAVQATAAARFGRLFAGTLWTIYKPGVPGRSRATPDAALPEPSIAPSATEAPVGDQAGSRPPV
ncbi:MAG TPA: patatin-like phospholipase family protein [Thermomicrobiales bacterium]|nr:patatin-like phospholipase family protein [Thermomicrobiales bacterium]